MCAPTQDFTFSLKNQPANQLTNYYEIDLFFYMKKSLPLSAVHNNDP